MVKRMTASKPISQQTAKWTPPRFPSICLKRKESASRQDPTTVLIKQEQDIRYSYLCFCSIS